MLLQSASRGRWAVAACFFVNGFIVGSWAPQIPLLAARFALSETTLGLLILVFALGGVSAMPLSGYLIGRFGSRPVLRIASLLCAFALLGVALAASFWPLILALIAFGAFLGAMDVSMNANAVAVERQLKRANMSSSHGFWSLGGFVGAGVGGLLIERWDHVFHAGAVTVFALVLVLAALPYLFAEARHEPETIARRRLRLPRSPLIYLTGLVALFSMAPEGAVLDWAALYLRQEMGANIATASLAYTAFSGAMAAMRFLGDGLRNRLGAVATLRLSGAIAAIGMLWAGLASSPLAAILAFALTGIGIANMVPIAFSAAGNQPGMSPGTGMSVATTIGYTGMLAAPSLVGFIAERTGFAPVFITFSLLLAAVVLMAELVRPADAIAPQPA